MTLEARPDLSGDWVLNRAACSLSGGASAVQDANLRIEHRDPVIRCSARFVFNDGNAAEFTTERTATQREAGDAAPAEDGSAHWDGDGLVFTDYMGEPESPVTMTWRYELLDDGRGLRAVERLRGGDATRTTSGPSTARRPDTVPRAPPDRPYTVRPIGLLRTFCR